MEMPNNCGIGQPESQPQQVAPQCRDCLMLFRQMVALNDEKARAEAALTQAREALKQALPVIEFAHKDATLSKNTPPEWWPYYEELVLVRAALAQSESPLEG